jgi:hypothetical protein
MKATFKFRNRNNKTQTNKHEAIKISNNSLNDAVGLCKLLHNQYNNHLAE